MKRIAILAAALLGAALFFGCSNSSDTPFIPSSGSGSSGPSVRIVGPNEMAANGVPDISTGVSATKTITLNAYTTGWADDAQVRYGWAISDDNGKTYGNSSVHVVVSNTTSTPIITLTAKDGDSSVKADAPQTVTVGVIVYKYDADPTKQAANQAAGIKASFNVTVKASQPDLKFREWAPDYDFRTPAGTEGVYKKATAPAFDAVNPGNPCGMAVAGTPIYNGYSANIATANANLKKGWEYITSDTEVAKLTVGSPAVVHDAATYTDTNGDAIVNSLCVNKTDKESVTLTVKGTYHLGASNDPEFTRKLTVKVNKGKKLTVNLTYTKDGYGSFTYGNEVVSTGSKALTDVYAGVVYVTENIGAKNTAGTDERALTGVYTDANRSTAVANTEATVNAPKITITIPYTTTETTRTWYLDWASND